MFVVYVCTQAYTCVHTHHSTYVNIRGQLVRVSSLLLPCGSLGTELRSPGLVLGVFTHSLSHLAKSLNFIFLSAQSFQAVTRKGNKRWGQ